MRAHVPPELMQLSLDLGALEVTSEEAGAPGRLWEMDRGFHKGQMREGRPHGFGIQFKDGELYVGLWKEGQRSGKGRQIFAN